MTKFKCQEAGCPYETDKEKNIRTHYSAKHHKPYPGGGAVPDDVIIEETQEKEDTFVTNEPEQAADPMNVLRSVLDIYRMPYQKEAIVQLFSNYNMEDLDHLDEILLKNGIKPNTRDLILETYAHALGIKVKEEPTGNQPGAQKLAAPFRDPMTITPEEIATMTFGQKMKYQQDLRQYVEALKFQRESMELIMGPLSPTTGKQGGSALSAEDQAMLKQAKEVLDREQRQKEMAPLYRRMDEMADMFQQSGANKKGTTGFEDLKEYAMTMKMLETMGSSKEAESIRHEAEQRMQAIQAQTQQQMMAQQQQAEQLRQANIALQIQSLQNQSNAQIALLQQQIQTQSGNKETLVGELERIQQVQAKLQQFATGQPPETAEDKKNKAVGGMVQSIMQGVSPALTAFVSGMGKGGAAAPGGPGPSGGDLVIDPMGPTGVQFPCTKCGNIVRAAGNPPVVVCPSCGTEYRAKNQAAASSQQAPLTPPPANRPFMVEPSVSSNREPTEAEIIAALMDAPDDVLYQKAEQRGIDPTMFNDKMSLVQAIAKMRT